jgi:MATE family multidrug resistance protein
VAQRPLVLRSSRRWDGISVFQSRFPKLASPNKLSAISIPLAGLINTMVMGRLGDAGMIGGIAISSALLDIIFFAFNFMRSGALGLTAQVFGAGDSAEQKPSHSQRSCQWR